MSPEDKYLNDPLYHAVVDNFVDLLKDFKVSPTELREAVMLACIINEQRMARRGIM